MIMRGVPHDDVAFWHVAGKLKNKYGMINVKYQYNVETSLKLVLIV